MSVGPGPAGPEAIRAQLAALRGAGARLRERPARETLDALARVMDGWSDSSSRWRRELLAALPDAAGFAPATVAEGLARGLAAYDGAALRALVAEELGCAERLEAGRPAGSSALSPFDVTAVVLAGSIPMPTLLAIALPLVLRSPVLVKPASRDPVTPRLVARSIADLDAGLGACVGLAEFDGDDLASGDALLEADCVVASGSDETIAALRARVRPPRRFLGYGHRVSAAILGPELGSRAGLEDAARRLAIDVALWDQLGCLSPQLVYAVSADPRFADRVADALARELASAQERWPRGRLEPGEAAAIAGARSEAEMRAAAGGRVVVHASSGTAWTVVREDSARLRASPLHRFVRVLPVADVSALLAALAPLGPHLAALAVEGFGTARAALHRRLAALGASRVCAPGSLQAPPLRWRRDGQPLLAPLVRFSDLEVCASDSSPRA